MRVVAAKMDSRCWSTDRALGSCYQCQRLERCKLREGKEGRRVVQRAKIAIMKAEMRRFPELIQAEEERLEEME
jgi:hypothetical protein